MNGRISFLVNTTANMPMRSSTDRNSARETDTRHKVKAAVADDIRRWLCVQQVEVAVAVSGLHGGPCETPKDANE